MQQVTLTIPNAVFGQDGGVIARDLLERATLEAYRTEVISIGRFADILGLSIDEAHGFLKAKGIPTNLSFEDIEQGFETLAANENSPKNRLKNKGQICTKVRKLSRDF